MRTKKLKLFLAAIIILAGGGFYFLKVKAPQAPEETITEISPTIAPIRIFISCAGTVLPKNRLEIKPPVNGRIERILVQEGQMVKAGEVLAWMSSTERAALLDAARGKGEESFKYWEETYKPIPLPAAIDGEVIVATTQPGQTVTTADAVVVLSDRLIVRAQVDETDIGKIKNDMKAFVSLDAYPDTRIRAEVSHIYYESKTVNNVTVYEVDLIPETIPSFFRSGMNATVDFIVENRDQALLIPLEAMQKDREGAYCLIKQKNAAEPLKARLTLGISDEKNVEVLSGITAEDRIIVRSKKYSLPQDTRRKNPFLPGR